MDFLKVFLRSIALLPSLIEGIETLFGTRSGEEKRQAAVEIAGSAINMADAVSQKQIADATGFANGLGLIVDGVVACLNASVWHQG